MHGNASLAGLVLIVAVGSGRAAPPPVVTAISPDKLATLAGAPAGLPAGETVGAWTDMGGLIGPDGARVAVFEDFTDVRGRIVVTGTGGPLEDFGKSLAPSVAEAPKPYRGHALEEVMQSDEDLLGREILAQPGDPDFSSVAACLPPIWRLGTYTFVGTPESADKIGFAYGGRSPAFDPAICVPAIRRIREARAVEDGLVGGWLPVVRFVYPEGGQTWSELLAFAPLRTVNGNGSVQPVWYRVARVVGGRLAEVHYFDTYVPYPPRGEGRAGDFYADLLALRRGWEAKFDGGMEISVPDPRLADMTRHSLVRAMMTRVNGAPKYGVVDRNYGGTEHDGFPDTFNTDTAALCEWGLLELAGRRIDDYFGHFVRDDGSILYRGPETGQFGRMLTVVAQYVNDGGDPGPVLRHRVRIEAIARLLRSLRQRGLKLPAEDPAHGLIAGWSEADSSLDPEPWRYDRPYFGNSAEAARGFRDLGRVWSRLGRERGDRALANLGEALQEEARGLEDDLRRAISRSVLRAVTPACLPAIAGVREPFHVAVARDPLDPLFRGYRSYMEMLYSGCLSRDEANLILCYRSAHRDAILGLPTAYGYNTHELAGFLTYGQAYGMLQHDFVREYLLTLYSLMAHQYTRGTWTAPETRNIEPGIDAAPYCVPAQLTVPLLTRWLLAFEDPQSETLWLARATPREWLADGQTISARRVPTRWGTIGFTVESQLSAGRIAVVVELPTRPFGATIRLRLRVPPGRQLWRVAAEGGVKATLDSGLETVDLPAGLSGTVKIVVEVN